VAAAGLLVFVGGALPPFSFGQTLSGGDFINEKRTVRAPELAGDEGWLNTEKPLSLAGLKGKIVLLDFWTYGCVNCIHIIPDLKRLEEKYPNELVVIGVHSAKFDNERETENIRRIILRYGIEHPVVNDGRFAIWNAYAVNAWPTQVLIDPDGYVIARVSGEGNYPIFDRLIQTTAAEFRKKGKLNESPASFALERAKVGSLPLAFPGKVLADEASKTLFISDTNHNRIVIADLSGTVRDIVGTGKPAFQDGTFSTAGFNKPQGLALKGSKLYVADTGNHSIRRVDLESGSVETVGGTGSLEGFNGFGGKALETSLRSPWDIEFSGGDLYIAMAGSHQVWKLDISKGYLEPYAGSRWEARIDGPVKVAAFAQPSGLASIGERLFVADSESNIIREIDTGKGRVETLAGGDLFKFGDEDGEGDEVRLQHPLAVEAWGGKVLIADTYNDKIKLLDPEKRTVRTFLGSGNEGQKDGKSAEFYEPGGLSLAGDILYIADTNNHAIRVADLNSGSVATLMLKGLAPPSIKEENENSAPGNIKIRSPKTVIANNPNVVLDVKLPEGFHLNPDAPQRVTVSLEGGAKLGSETRFRPGTIPFSFPLKLEGSGPATVRVRYVIYYCREDNTGVCYIRTLDWTLPVEISPEGSGKIGLVADLKKEASIQ